MWNHLFLSTGYFQLQNPLKKNYNNNSKNGEHNCKYRTITTCLLYWIVGDFLIEKQNKIHLLNIFFYELIQIVCCVFSSSFNCPNFRIAAANMHPKKWNNSCPEMAWPETQSKYMYDTYRHTMHEYIFCWLCLTFFVMWVWRDQCACSTWWNFCCRNSATQREIMSYTNSIKKIIWVFIEELVEKQLIIY